MKYMQNKCPFGKLCGIVPLLSQGTTFITFSKVQNFGKGW